MCGINGIFAYNPVAGAPDEQELLRTRDAMAKRGPDGAGVWWSRDRRCAFGHRRLSIIDLSERASQPMVSACGRYVITFNGEIYNYVELMRDLEARGARFRTTSDTEVLLELFAREGAEMVGRLRGMFAFAIWDTIECKLFLARDPYGIKPLYYANDGWTFRFASQVKALLAGGKVSRDPEPAGVVGFYIFGNVPEPFTLYRDIRALPAGHLQWVDQIGPREPKRYANLAAVLCEGAKKVPEMAELRAVARAGILDSVKAHLVADVEVGVFLSAGIDSGALLGLTRDAGQDRIRAITLGFDEFAGTHDDEVPLAAEAARRFGAQHIVRRIGEAEFRADLPRIFDAMDQPTIDGVNTWFVAKAAREAGLKVALSGLGGDELLAGYSSFSDIPLWHRRYGWLARIPLLGSLAAEAIPLLAPRYSQLHPKAAGVLRYAGSWSGAYLLRRSLFLPDELGLYLDAEFVREGMRRLKPLAILSGALTPDPGSDCARVCALESQLYMRNQLLRDADWAGMAHGIEIRVPFVDARLLERMASAIPVLKPGEAKLLLARMPSRPLSVETVARAKTGFAVPTGRWTEKAARTPHDGAQLPAGLVSRRWSRTVLDALAPARAAAA